MRTTSSLTKSTPKSTIVTYNCVHLNSFWLEIIKLDKLFIRTENLLSNLSSEIVQDAYKWFEYHGYQIKDEVTIETKRILIKLDSS